MRTFTGVNRVRVLHDAEGREIGATGFVARRRCGDDGAWISLDARHSDPAVHPFPADDDAGRGTHVLAYPEDCEVAQ